MLIAFRCMSISLYKIKFNLPGQRDSGQHVTLSPRLSDMTSWWLFYFKTIHGQHIQNIQN